MKVLVVGAGGTGSHASAELARAGHDVVLASRSGSPGSASAPGGPPVQPLRLDANDPVEMARAARGAAVIVNALNPPYTKWAEAWPPMAASFLRAAEASGAGLVTVGNLYGYGHVDAPMTETGAVNPNGTKGRVREAMWADALAAHAAGRIRAVEVRASDYFGPGATPGVSVLNDYVISPAARGKSGHPPFGGASVAHSWTYLPDVGAMVAAVAQTDQEGRDWGRVWHVPTAAPRSMNQVASDVAALVGGPAVRVRPWPVWLRSALKRVVPILREFDETAHQFERPFILDSSQAESRFGLEPTGWDRALAATLAAMDVPLRDQPRADASPQ